MRGITITNYLSGGDPEGIIFSYLSNWGGQAIKIGRNLSPNLKPCPNYKDRVYIYFLGRILTTQKIKRFI